MDNITITSIMPDEWTKYKNLRLRALKEEPQAYGSSYAENSTKPEEFWKQRLLDAIQEKTQWLVFAKSDNHLVGMVGAFAEKEPDVAHIISVYVVPEARGNGISKDLMRDLLNRIKRNSWIKKIIVDVNPQQHAALNLYKNLGFKIIKHYKMILGDGNEHDVYQMGMLIK